MRTDQSGNVVIFILLAVGLFGALAFTFTRGGQQGQGNMNSQQAKIAAQEIIAYGAQLEKATNKLLARGCSETQLNYDHSSFTLSHDNTTAPADGSCDIFGAAGAGLTQALVSENVFGLPATYNMVSSVSTIAGTPSTKPELYWIIEIPGGSKALVCSEINSLLGITAALVSNTNTNVPFVGTFAASGNVTDVSLTNLSAGCHDYSLDTTRKFYFQILIAR